MMHLVTVPDSFSKPNSQPRYQARCHGIETISKACPSNWSDGTNGAEVLSGNDCSKRRHGIMFTCNSYPSKGHQSLRNPVIKTGQDYSTRDSRMIIHCSTNLGMLCLDMAERTGSLSLLYQYSNRAIDDDGCDKMRKLRLD